MNWSGWVRGWVMGVALASLGCRSGSDPEQGWLAEAPASHAALTDCSGDQVAEATVEPVTGFAEQYLFQGSTSDGQSRVRGYVGCDGGGAGRERVHRLDLSHLTGPFRLYAIVDAEFEPVLVLGSGECSDVSERACARDPFGRTEARLAEELEPGVHIIVVDGVDEDDHGAYTLRVVAEPLGVECGVPGNTACSNAVPLVFQGTTAHAFLPVFCLDQGPSFFSFELSSAASQYGVEARIDVEDFRVGEDFEVNVPSLRLWSIDSTDECAIDDPLVTAYPYTLDGSPLGASLPPGRYAVGVRSSSSTWLERQTYLRVEVQPLDCSSELRETCEDAEAIVLEGDRAVVEGNTYCSTHSLVLPDCGIYDPTPDRLYRLDLRDRKEPVRLRAKIPPSGLDFYAVLSLFREEDRDCGTLLHCFDAMASLDGWPSVDAIVKPGVYLLSVRGVEPLVAGKFTLYVDVSDWRTREFYPCYGGDVDQCAFTENNAAFPCADNPLQAGCGEMFVSCGLLPSVQACVCDSDPVCCDGARSDTERCAEVFRACDYFCPDAATSAAYMARTRLFSLASAN
jgi:hypothetical protein